jgi:hypothetical protein
MLMLMLLMIVAKVLVKMLEKLEEMRKKLTSSKNFLSHSSSSLEVVLLM